MWFWLQYESVHTFYLFSLISQFFAHPVIYNLTSKKWFGKFSKMKNSSWLTIQRWLWLFLNVWCLFDLVMFPLLFALFYMKHLTNKNKLKNKGTVELCFLKWLLLLWDGLFCTFSYCSLTSLRSSAPVLFKGSDHSALLVWLNVETQ